MARFLYAGLKICYLESMDQIIKPLFWDAEEKDIDFDAHASYVIERVLEHGDPAQVRWLFGRYSSGAIKSVAETSRSLSLRSRNYWRIKLKIWTPQRSVPLRSAIWQY